MIFCIQNGASLKASLLRENEMAMNSYVETDFSFIIHASKFP